MPMSDERALELLRAMGRVIPEVVRAIRLMVDGDPHARRVLEIMEAEGASARAAAKLRGRS